MASEEVMSTPINELGSEPQQNISENIMKNYESMESPNNNIEQLSTPITDYNDNVDVEPPKPIKKSNKSNKSVSFSTKKCNKPNNLMCMLKPALIVFLIILLFSYPLFDVKILKLIPKTLSEYDNITLIGLVVKAILGALLFVVAYKFI